MNGDGAAEALADAMHDEVLAGCWVDWELASIEDSSLPLTEGQRELVEAGMEAAYLNTLRMLIRRGMLQADGR